MYKLHEDFKGIHYIIKEKYEEKYKDKVKKSLIKNIDQALKKSNTSKDFEVPYLYRTAYQEWYELKQFMNLFNFDINNSREKTLAYKIIQSIGDNIPIFGIGNGLFKWTDKHITLNLKGMHYQYKFIKNGYKFDYFYYLKSKIIQEFNFINSLFGWVNKHYPTHKKRAIQQLKSMNEIFTYDNKNETIKAIDLIEKFNLNQTPNAKVYLLSKLIYPYTLSDEEKLNFTALFKLQYN